MKQFKTVFIFEMKYYLKNKIFVGVTLGLALLIGIVMFLPRFTGNDDKETVSKDSVLYVNIDESINKDEMYNLLNSSLPSYDIKFINKSNKDTKDLILKEEDNIAITIDKDFNFFYYVNNMSMSDGNIEIIQTILQKYYQITKVNSEGVAIDKVNEIFSKNIEYNIVNIGSNQSDHFFYTYVMVMALYLVVIMYGQLVATSVASEKSSRAMELLVTSVKPVNMLFGKVLAATLAGFLQLFIVFGSSILFYQLNKSYWSDNYLIETLFAMPIDLLVYMLIFFVLGFLIYAFLFGAIGSTVSKVEDLNTAVMPITLIFIVAFVVVITGMSSGNINSLPMRIFSYIPLTSPMAMFTRIAMGNVPFYEVVISIGILIVSVAFVGVIAAKIYRVGVLLYGNKFNIKEIIKALKNA